MTGPRRGHGRGTWRLPSPAALLFLAAALFRLWDGRTLEVEQWITHGDEYVVTLGDGRSLIIPQREVREIVPGGPAPRPAPPASPSPPPRRPSPPR